MFTTANMKLMSGAPKHEDDEEGNDEVEYVVEFVDNNGDEFAKLGKGKWRRVELLFLELVPRASWWCAIFFVTFLFNYYCSE